MKATAAIPESVKELLTKAYHHFNTRNIDGALSLMMPQVDWPNGMEGGYEHGHDAVRAYWTRQWTLINPHVAPLEVEKTEDDRYKVEVNQLVKNLEGAILADLVLYHTYTIKNGLIQHMEISK